MRTTKALRQGESHPISVRAGIKRRYFFSGGMKELLTRVCATHPASPLDLPPVALRYDSKKQGGEGSPFKCN